MEEKQFNFGIIGAGPAGYTAAIRASQLGKTVVLFEKENLGGTCLNKGCIPTKAFLHAADVYNSIKKASGLGIEVENVFVDFVKIAKKKDKTVEKVRKSLEMLLKSYDIEIVKSEAFLGQNSNTIMSDGVEYECVNIIIATGASPKTVGGFEFDHDFILSSDDVLNLKSLPQKVLIVGSGAIGIEWARIFSSFGTEVTVVEIADRLLPLADFEVSQRLERIFKMAKIKMHLQTSVKEITDKKVTLSTGEVLEPDFVLFATGRKPEKAETTGQDNVFIVGDSFGSIQLAHFASHQAVSLVEKIVLNKETKDFIVPSVVYGNPEIAWFGKTEQELKDGGINYKKSVFPIAALGKAAAEGNLEGFIKVLAFGDEILGAHIISKEASSLVHQLLVLVQNGLGIEAVKKCCFAHPTYSEGIFESVLGLDGESLSLLNSK